MSSLLNVAQEYISSYGVNVYTLSALEYIERCGRKQLSNIASASGV